MYYMEILDQPNCIGTIRAVRMKRGTGRAYVNRVFTVLLYGRIAYAASSVTGGYDYNNTAFGSVYTVWKMSLTITRLQATSITEQQSRLLLVRLS